MVKEPRKPKPGSFWHKRHARYTRGRLRTEIITAEETAWLIIGLIFGWFAGRGAPAFILLIPIIMIIVWIYEQNYAQKYGVRTIHGKLVRKR